MQVFTGRESVADFEVARVGQTHDVARPGLVDNALFLSHERRGSRETHLFVLANMVVIDITLELARADLYEGDARTVVGVHVGVNLEDEARESILARIHHTLHGLHRLGFGGYLHKTVE